MQIHNLYAYFKNMHYLLFFLVLQEGHFEDLLSNVLFEEINHRSFYTSGWYCVIKDVVTVCYCRSVTKSYPTLCDSMDCSTPGFPVLHYLPELAQTHVHWVDDAIQSSHPLSPPFSAAFNLSQHQDLFQWISSSHQVTKLLDLQHQSFQWVFRVDFL